LRGRPNTERRWTWPDVHARYFGDELDEHSLTPGNPRIAPLEAGHPVIAAANPLRGLAADAASFGDLVRTIDGPSCSSLTPTAER
jgi:hypothetical protein